MLVKNVTIGADIEVFLKDMSSNEVISAEGIIKGTKEEPFKFVEGNDYFGISLDNVLAEFCIPPVKNAQEWFNNISFALNYIKENIPNGLGIEKIPSARLDFKWLQTENAKLFGCEVDFNAWMFGQMNPKPELKDGNENLRSCGGHIHIGYDKPDFDLSLSLVKAMDIFVGLPSVIQEPDNERKSLYGKAGAFRTKPYGIEYRTVSNYYLASETLTKWVFNNTLEAIEWTNKGLNLSGEEGEAIRAAINFADKELAQTMCKYFGVKLAA